MKKHPILVAFFSFLFVLSACTPNAQTNPLPSESPKTPSATPAESSEPENPEASESSSPETPGEDEPLPEDNVGQIWIGQWKGGTYACHAQGQQVGETLEDDTLTIESIKNDNQVTIILYEKTITPAKVTGVLKEDKIEISEQEVNGGPASGEITQKDGKLTLKLLTAWGSINCEGEGYTL